MALVALAGSARGQSADKIIDQYLRAAGGVKVLRRITTVRVEGTVGDSATGKSGSYTLITKAPSRLYSEIVVGAVQTTEAYNGKSAWRQNSGGLETLTGAESARLEARARYSAGGLANHKKEKIRATLLGDATVHERPADHLQITTAAGLRQEVFLDQQSHLLLEEKAPDRNGEGERITYDDYRPVEGAMEPYRLEIRRGSGVLRVSVTRVAINSPVDDAIFDFPSRSAQPLPDIVQLLKDVNQNQKQVDALVDQYACRETEEENELGGKGQAKQKTVREYEVFYLGGEEVRRLVRKNGKDLTGDELRKENERVEKRVHDYEKQQQKDAGKSAEAKKRKEEEAGIASILRVSRFVNPRRERFRGHDVIVFDFEPNPGYQPKNLTENVLQKLVGVAWVDEQARQVVRLEARFNASMKIGGGLVASVQKGSAFAFEQSKINDEVWLPSYAEVHFMARMLLLKGMQGDFVTRFSDYKKFRVESVVRKD
ncbi:MAG: hypothetical protein ACLQOO_06715 [Terriglobia bacterium]